MTASDRILTLDVVRGVAVMGILIANLPAFALPEAAYFSPLAAGGTTPADIAAWLANFVLIEGKMRGLFSLLFGASMLLVIDRARAAGDPPATIHFARMAVLFAIGVAHLYLIWWGDILAHYALCGAIAYPFARLRSRGLLIAGIAVSLVGAAAMGGALGLILDSAARDTPQAQATWATFNAAFGTPPAADLAREIAALRGNYAGAVAWRWQHAMGPIDALWLVGPQTLGTMLLGMAAYRSDFLTGMWDRARYRRWAVLGLAAMAIGYLAIGGATIAHGFAIPWVYAGAMVVSLPFRLAGIAGYAALVVLLIRPGGWLTVRIAAAGRMALSNYLATSIAMTFVFQWGLGQMGAWGRAELYWLAPLAWTAMLGWSAPWLARYRQGPAEWLWRSLSRLDWQPLRARQ